VHAQRTQRADPRASTANDRPDSWQTGRCITRVAGRETNARGNRPAQEGTGDAARAVERGRKEREEVSKLPGQLSAFTLVTKLLGGLFSPMNEELRRSFIEAWHSLPIAVRSAPATEEQLRQFESSFGAIPEDFRWFLTTCGGGPVGSEWVDDIERLTESHRKFRGEAGPGGWTMKGVFIIGWDGNGNPFGIELSTGKLLVEDHDIGGIHQLAESFENFLVSGL